MEERNTAPRKLRLALVAASLTAMLNVAYPSLADNSLPEEARGYHESGYDLSQYETINLANGNLTFRVPLYTLRTDGGLSYDLALFFNSKLWYTRSYCSVDTGGMGGWNSCQSHNGEYLEARIADGIEAYGFGWDMRPPWVKVALPGEGGTIVGAAQLWFIDSSGAEHPLLGPPPGTFPYDPDCFYPQDGLTYRFRVVSSDEVLAGSDQHPIWVSVPTVIEMEDGSGTLYEFSHIVPRSCQAPWSELDPDLTNLTPFNFRANVTGLYLTRIRRGPWSGGVAANEITFEYLGEATPSGPPSNSKWDDDTCGESLQEPWLLSAITASGESPRSVTISYAPTGGRTIATAVSVPLFDPTLESGTGAGSSSDITLTVRQDVNRDLFQQRNGPHPNQDDPPGTLVFLAPRLTSVAFPNGASFDFDQSIPQGAENWFPIKDVTLPSGALVEYQRGEFPVGLGMTTQFAFAKDSGGGGGGTGAACNYWSTCGVSPPQPDLSDPANCPSRATLSSSGVTARIITFSDASTTPDTPTRVETTYFYQSLACGQKGPNWWARFGEEDLPLWPYDFFYALQSPMDTASSASYPEYLWTLVLTSEGTAGPTPGDPSLVAEIHRFNAFTRQEFSADTIVGPGVYDAWGDADSMGFVSSQECLRDGEPCRIWRPSQHDPYVVLRDAWDVQVLKHEEVEHAIRCDDHCPFPAWPDGAELYSYVSRKSSYTAEDQPWPPLGTPPNVTSCSRSRNPRNLGSGTDWMWCPETTETQDVDDFLNPVWRDVVSASSHSGMPDVHRHWQYEYDGIDDGSAQAVWHPHRKTREDVCDVDSEGHNISCSAHAWHWTDIGGNRPLFLPDYEWENPDSTANDYVEHHYSYDSVNGNLESDEVSGGYNSGASAPTTKYSYSHGQQNMKRLVDGDGHSLVLWQREIDPGTGLVRWQVDGSGAGSGYLYDAMGRVTDIIPIERRHHPGSQEPFEIFVQRAWDGSALTGAHVHYRFPVPPDKPLLEHVVSDATYTIDGAFLLVGSTTPRSAFLFDGLGRLTQEVERYRAEEPRMRSRFSLRFHHRPGSGAPCDDGDRPWDLLERNEVRLSSEWVDGSDWPADACGASPGVPWTETQLDGLGRPALVHSPDGSIVRSWYWGDSVVESARSVATNLTPGSEQEVTTTRWTDALGRLLATAEGDYPGVSPVSTAYEYDERDRLNTVNVAGQTRQYTYSQGGFLTDSVEPERSATFTSYDALGNLRGEVSGGVGAVYDYDGFGRLMSKTVGGRPASSLTYGDQDEGGGYDVGEREYGKVVEAVQHNWFDARDVAITERWRHSGPGNRVSRRRTAISGVGGPDDSFELSYAYDRFGNVGGVVLPVWQEECRYEAPLSEALFTYDGPWLTTVEGLTATEPPVAIPIAELSYHPSGRVKDLVYGDGFAFEHEQADPSGMSRPQGFALRQAGSATALWAEGPYAYDGSGNIREIEPKLFSYDGLDRLTAFSSSGSTWADETYAYDDWGNLEMLGGLQLVVDPTSNRVLSVTQPGSQSQAPAWDLRGNLTRMPPLWGNGAKAFAFSGEDRLQVSTGLPNWPLSDPGDRTRYAYDTSGERVLSWVRTSPDYALQDVTFYLRDEQGRVISDWLWAADGATFLAKNDYFYAGSRLVGQMDNTLARMEHVASDHLGSTRIVFYEDDYGHAQILDTLDYYPFGAVRIGPSIPDTTHLFTGHERDLGDVSSQLDYMHARYYSNRLGRFVSVDPVGGEVGSSQSWNRYSYVVNNPIGVVDPTGMEEVEEKPPDDTAGGTKQSLITPELIDAAKARLADLKEAGSLKAQEIVVAESQIMLMEEVATSQQQDQILRNLATIDASCGEIIWKINNRPALWRDDGWSDLTFGEVAGAMGENMRKQAQGEYTSTEAMLEVTISMPLSHFDSPGVGNAVGATTYSVLASPIIASGVLSGFAVDKVVHYSTGHFF